MFIGDNREDYSLDTIMAQEKYSDIINNPNHYKFVRSHDSSISVDLYEEYDNNEVICWFVPTNNTFVLGYVAYNILNDGGIETTTVFNDKQVPFLAFKVYMYYLLEKYNYILSDKRHTGSGKKFWENLVNFTVNTKKVTVMDHSTNDTIEEIKDSKELEKYYGDVYSEKYRIKIENI
jgi:hypothetical protein